MISNTISSTMESPRTVEGEVEGVEVDVVRVQAFGMSVDRSRSSVRPNTRPCERCDQLRRVAPFAVVKGAEMARTYTGWRRIWMSKSVELSERLARSVVDGDRGGDCDEESGKEGHASRAREGRGLGEVERVSGNSAKGQEQAHW